MAKLTEEERKALGGSSYDQQYFTDDELRSAAKARAEAEKTGDWTSAHNYVETIRKNYGYSGDVNGKNDGGGYTALNDAAKAVTTTSQAPTYVNQYADAMNNLLDAYNSRAAFSYNYNTDPSYQAYKKQYTREGQRATADTLGQAAALTGGMPSTAAVTAASQAGDYYASQLSDKIPELYNAAYSMYQNEGNDMLNKLNMYMQLENADYSKYQDQLNQYYNDRNYNYQVAQDELAQQNWQTQFDYQKSQDELAQQNYLTELALAKQKSTQQSNAYSTVLKNATGKAEINLSSAKEYLEDMVDQGRITPEEAYEIWSVEIGGDSDSAKAKIATEILFGQNYPQYLQNSINNGKYAIKLK